MSGQAVLEKLFVEFAEAGDDGDASVVVCETSQAFLKDGDQDEVFPRGRHFACLEYFVHDRQQVNHRTGFHCALEGLHRDAVYARRFDAEH